MARRVYDTGGASAEEISDILGLLRDNHIPHYETPRGVFGLTPGAIWVSRDADYGEARELIEHYDRARAQRVRETYANRTGTGTSRGSISVLSSIRKFILENPRNAVLYAVIIILLVAIHWLFYRAITQL